LGQKKTEPPKGETTDCNRFIKRREKVQKGTVRGEKGGNGFLGGGQCVSGV